MGSLKVFSFNIKYMYYGLIEEAWYAVYIL